MLVGMRKTGSSLAGFFLGSRNFEFADDVVSAELFSLVLRRVAYHKHLDRLDICKYTVL